MKDSTTVHNHIYVNLQFTIFAKYNKLYQFDIYILYALYILRCN